MTAAAIDGKMVLERAPDTLAAPVQDRLLMLSVSRGSYFEFSPVMRRIWELLETPRTFADLITSLTEEYEVDPQTCHDEVLQVVQALIAEGLLNAA